MQFHFQSVKCPPEEKINENGRAHTETWLREKREKESEEDEERGGGGGGQRIFLIGTFHFWRILIIIMG